LGPSHLYFKLSSSSITFDIRGSYLGPPDLEDVTSDDATYVYLYDRFASKDWCVIVFASDHLVTQIGVNAAGASGVSRFNTYSTKAIDERNGRWLWGTLAALAVRGKPDAEVQALKDALDGYEAEHPGAEAALYRHNPASIRLRVIDGRFD
jgi:hypothetical protein